MVGLLKCVHVERQIRDMAIRTPKKRDDRNPTHGGARCSQNQQSCRAPRNYVIIFIVIFIAILYR